MVDRETQRIDYDAMRDLARKERPQMIVTGATAYPRQFDFKMFGEIAKGGRRVPAGRHFAYLPG